MRSCLLCPGFCLQVAAVDAEHGAAVIHLVSVDIVVMMVLVLPRAVLSVLLRSAQHASFDCSDDEPDRSRLDEWPIVYNAI